MTGAVKKIMKRIMWDVSGEGFTESSQKNQHSPLDSANNKYYITARTKEGEQIREVPEGIRSIESDQIKLNQITRTGVRKAG